MITLILSLLAMMSSEANAQSKTLNCSNAAGTVQIQNSVVIIRTHNGAKALQYQYKDLIIDGRGHVVVRKGEKAKDTNCNKMQLTEVYDYIDSFTISRKDDKDLVPASAGEVGKYNIEDYFLCSEVKFAKSPCQ